MDIEELNRGGKYRKADFGITGIVRLWSEITVQGELCIFFSDDGKFHNIREKDGFVYEGRGAYALIPYGKKAAIQRHVFLHEHHNELSYYTYLGKGLYETRYDETHNKIFFKEEA
jgi:hypothetical protein